MKTYLSSKNHLCLIGGGHTHVMVIRQLLAKPLRNTDITLISPDAHTAYSGMLPGLIAGHYSFEECHINLHRLCQWAGIKFVRSSVERINLDLQIINCSRIPPIKYDLLSINIGSHPAIHGIRGAETYGHAIKPVGNFLLHWSLWLKSHAGSRRKRHIVVIGGGAGGIEVLLAMHYRLQNTTTLDASYTLINADSTILAAHNSAVQNFFIRHLQSLNITVKNGRVASIDRHLLHLQDGSSLEYDFAVWATHAGAYSWPAESGLRCNTQGFIMINQYLQSIEHHNIFAAGDCAAFLPKALPKAGVFAVRQGTVLSNNIIATFTQKKLIPFEPQQRFLSLLTTGRKHAVVSRGLIFLQGKWVWHWKNYIDRKFMQHFHP
ncbi:selenide, water dikinase [Nitrosomonas sp. Nm51]|uniref:FAD-dependent oxidoreductase n=1 Tax=Nitrosomonas sp. Nm51 TaxID=133720 RepID=UPI0008C3C5C0|nr:FAD-dependent oxidoreductase [Nitrosomonas sp. Nm51]SEQ82210.1 selenide, water dikinase [Nitrosomonas sp. Nm51]